MQICYATNSTEEPIAMLPGKNQQNHNMSHCHEISVTMYDTFHIMRPICSPVLNQKRCAYMFIYIYTCTWPRYINHERTSVTYVLLYMLTFTVAYVFAEAKPQQKSHLILHMTLLNYDPTKNYTWLCLHMILLKQDTGQSYPSKIPAPKQSTQTKSQH